MDENGAAQSPNKGPTWHGTRRDETRRDASARPKSPKSAPFPISVPRKDFVEF